MEVAVLTLPVGMVIVLGMSFLVVDIARGIVVELVKVTLAAKDLGNHVRAALLEHSVAFQNLLSRVRHRLKL